MMKLPLNQYPIYRLKLRINKATLKI